MKNILILVLIVLASILWAENYTDGPYIFSDKSDFSIKYLIDGKVVKDEIIIPEGSEKFVEIPELKFKQTIENFLPEIPDWKYQNVEKIFAISDIHGQNDRFVQILRAHEVIDADNNWSFGAGHLVVLGDIFDRGDQVTEALWLIKSLESEAPKSGGMVHLLLGNHEVSILNNKDRMVNDKYLETAKKLKINHWELFSNDSVLGRWLRTRNTIIKIDDKIFVHGGLSPEFLANNYQLPQVNNFVRKVFTELDQSLRASELGKYIFSGSGPFWYRGYFVDKTDYQQIKRQEALDMLKELDSEYMVIGHTTQDFINPFFKNRYFPIDAGIKYGDAGEGLLIENGKFYRAKADGYLEELD